MGCRRGCDPIDVSGCQCSVEDTDCIEVSGAGTSANPFTFSLNLDPSDTQLLSCGEAGLLAEMPDLYRDPPRVQVRNSQAQIIAADNVPTYIEFDYADWDTAGFWDPGDDPGKLLIPVDGLYVCHFAVTLDNPGGDFPALGQIRAYVLEHNSNMKLKDVQVDVDPNTSVRLGKSRDVEFHAGNFIGLQVQNGYHVDLNALPDDGVANLLSLRWVAPLSVPAGS